MRPDLFPTTSLVPCMEAKEGAMATMLRRTIPQWRTVVIDSYAQLPTLSLTAPQGRRLWGMDASTCGYVLDSLVEAGVLTRTPCGQYCRADVVRPVDTAFAM